MPFRFRAKTVFLTYSQISHDGLRDLLSSDRDHYELLSERFGPPEQYRLGRERHQDGGHHFHCFASWGSRISSTDPRCFDWRGYHPNIEAVRKTPRKAWDYAGKDGDIVYEQGEGPRMGGTPPVRREGIWSEAVAATSADHFLQTIREGAPRDFVLYQDALVRFAEKFWAPPAPSYTSPWFFSHEPRELADWLQQSGIGIDGGHVGRRRSLIIWGPTRTGKTLWARSLGR